MDVSKYSLDGEWITIEVNSDRELEPFEFKVQPIVEAGFKAASKSPDELTSLAIESVIGWNLTDGTDPIPCDEKTKRRYLTRFAAYMVKTVNGKHPDEKQVNRAKEARSLADTETDPEARLTAELLACREEEKIRQTNLVGAIVEFAGSPDNFLKN